MEQAAVLYHEPEILTILIQSSFVLALNAVDFVLDKAIYCGLVGQILLGTAYGSPGANILGIDLQQTITDLGYLGLILVVFEGGLSTSISALRANFAISTVVALTGIFMSIAMSFILMKISNASTLQAFAAGCALSSTSLGTTFTILKTSGLDTSRLGIVLSSAAMFDDVVGLVLVQVISNLGSSSGGRISASTIIRPVFVSVGFAALASLFVYLTTWSLHRVDHLQLQRSALLRLAQTQRGQFIVHTLLLLGAVTGAAYAGTSTLFAAYLAGLLISSIESSKQEKPTSTTETSDPPTPAIIPTSNSDKSPDGVEAWEMVNLSTEITEAPHLRPETPRSTQDSPPNSQQYDTTQTPRKHIACQTDSNHTEARSSSIYNRFYLPAVNRLLKPFFFASIGLSIPMGRLFQRPALWRGIVYAILMTLGKLSCGLWLVRFSRASRINTSPPANAATKLSNIFTSYRPRSLYPSLLLGSAMVSRGEIGFLISAVADTNGIFLSKTVQGNGSEHDDEIFLVLTWAILLCTIVGPISVGLLTRRVKWLRKEANANSGREDPLGVWADIKSWEL